MLRRKCCDYNIFQTKAFIDELNNLKFACSGTVHRMMIKMLLFLVLVFNIS